MAGCGGADPTPATNASAALFGAAAANWDLNFSSFSATMATSERTVTFLGTANSEGRQLSAFDDATGMYRLIDCRQVVNRMELVITYAAGSGRFDITETSIEQYRGTECALDINGAMQTNSPVRSASRRLTAVRTGSSVPSSFGELGGTWQITNPRGAVACTVMVAGSSFNGDCEGYTFRGSLNGAMLSVTDNQNGSMSGLRR